MTRYPKEVEKNFNQREGYLASLQDKKIVSTREEAEDRARRGFALIDRALTALPEVKPKGIQEKLFGENAVRRREREEQEKDREYEDRRRQEEASSDAMLPPEEQERLRLARLTSQRAVGLHLLLNTVHLLRSETALLGGRPPSKEDLLREEYHERYTRKYRKMREEVDDYRARVEDYRDKGQQRTQGIRTSK